MKKKAGVNQKNVTVEQRKVFRKKSKDYLMNLNGVLLAGGKSSRFGFNKLDIRNCTTPIFIDQIVKLSFFCNIIIVVTSAGNHSLVAAELKKIDSYFDFFHKYIEKYYKVQKNFERTCEFPDKIPEVVLLVDEDFNRFGQNAFDRAAAEAQGINKKGIKEEDTKGHIRDQKAKREVLKYSKPTEEDLEESGLKDCGPILGMYTGLKNAPDYYSLVLASDMPFVSHRLLQLLAACLKINFTCANKSKGQLSADSGTARKPEHAISSFTTQKKCSDIYVVKKSKGFEVLCGIYSKFCINLIAENIKAKKNKITDIINGVSAQILDESVLQTNGIDDLNFFNLNKSEDYDDYINIWNSKAFNIRATLNSSERNEETLYALVWAEFFMR